MDQASPLTPSEMGLVSLAASIALGLDQASSTFLQGFQAALPKVQAVLIQSGEDHSRSVKMLETLDNLVRAARKV